MKTDLKIFKHLMALLTKTGMQGRRHAICWDYSKGRTESSKELYNNEMLAIIHDLEKGFKELDRADLMRKKMISMAHEMNWRTAPSNSPGGGRTEPMIDMQRVDGWCVKYGMYHKRLNAHNYQELTKLVTQFGHFYASFINNL